MDTLQHIQQRATRDSRSGVPPAAVVFDPYAELVWLASNSRQVASFCGSSLSAYTSFVAPEEVRSVQPTEEAVVVVTSEWLMARRRNGMPLGQVTIKNHDLMAICVNPTRPHCVLVGGTSGQLLEYDVLRASSPPVPISVPFSKGIVLLRTSGKHVAVAHDDGSVSVADSSNGYEVVECYQAHQLGVSSMDIQKNVIVTTGYSKRQTYMTAAVVDPLINVFDLRRMKPSAPLSFPEGASFVVLHPKIHNMCFACSSSGHLQFMDLSNISNFRIYQVNLGGVYGSTVAPSIVSMDVSSTGEYLILVDNMNNLYLWSTDPTSNFNKYSSSLDYPVTSEVNGPIKFPVDDFSQSLNVVGMPYYKELLLSNFPSDAKFNVGALPTKIPTELSKHPSFQLAHYNKNKYGPRNLQKQWYSLEHKNQDSKGPKFISEQDNSTQKNTEMLEYKPKSSVSVPAAFSKLHILYSKFGIEDFDFQFYNRSNGKYSGLEIDIDNSYCNSLLVLYRFVPELYNWLTENLTQDDFDRHSHERSVQRELGYLYDMMANSGGKNCRTTNFQKVFNNIPEAVALRLQDKSNRAPEEDEMDKLQNLILMFNSFLLKELNGDSKSSKFAAIHDIFAMKQELEVKSASCAFSSRTSKTIYNLDLCSGPVTNFIHKSKPTRPGYFDAFNNTILPYIEAAMINQASDLVGSWCPECSRFEGMNVVNTIKNLPHVLSLNLHLDDDREIIRNFSSEQISQENSVHWLVNEFYAKLSNTSQRPLLKLNRSDFYGKNESNFTNELEKLSLENSRKHKPNDIIKYELLGFVCEICGSDQNHSAESKHLVTFVKDEGQWYLFNDFLIIPIEDEKEVFNLSYWWKKPLIVLYKSDKSESNFHYKIDQSHLNTEVLYRDYFAKGTREGKIIEYELLTKEEAPKPGNLVALDAEFVVLESDKYEIRSNSTKVMIKPKRSALARVSVVRGDPGPKKGLPFIDDYIMIDDPIEDYLTSFSGIEPGDLDPETSNKALTYMEVAYRKLWLLLQIGVIFVGHGLANDFRAVNIQVPPQQVRDTLVLYSKKNVKRKLGLKFLMYVVLGKNVQTGNHDSIEDARSALELYDRYKELVKEGKLQKELDRIYQVGANLGFKVPV